MRLLIYGFGPYRRFHDNITATIVGSLSKRPGLNAVVFPVRFDRRQFIAAIERYRPDCILGLGQSTRRRIEVESRATNWRRVDKTAPRRAIFKTKPNCLPTTLELRTGRQTAISANAGDYVCNYSMYVMLDYIATQKLNIPFGFIHIPHNCERRRASRFIERILRRCARSIDRKSLAKPNCSLPEKGNG
jgi:pyroglutamyl-peptidase